MDEAVRRGRPPLPEKDRKGKIIGFRASPSLYKKLAARAKRNKRTISGEIDIALRELLGMEHVV
jgi:hypothetical protein